MQVPVDDIYRGVCIPLEDFFSQEFYQEFTGKIGKNTESAHLWCGKLLGKGYSSHGRKTA